jgi:acyl dehydratase
MSSVVPVDEFTAIAGRDLGYSEWFTIEQDRIDSFADVTGDHQFIHVDPAAAAQTPFGSTIAHGFLTLSLVTTMFYEITLYPENMVMAINYGLNKLRFLSPVRVGKRVRLHAVVADVVERSPGSYLVTNDVTVEIEGEERPALVAQFLVLNVVAG